MSDSKSLNSTNSKLSEFFVESKVISNSTPNSEHQNKHMIDKADGDDTSELQNNNIQKNKAGAQQSKDGEIVAIDICILGRTYTIQCPFNEQDSLNEATQHIDDFVTELRDEAPHLTYENLLVLCCLNLYEQTRSQQSATVLAHSEVEQAHTLVDELLNQMRSL